MRKCILHTSPHIHPNLTGMRANFHVKAAGGEGEILTGTVQSVDRSEASCILLIGTEGSPVKCLLRQLLPLAKSTVLPLHALVGKGVGNESPIVRAVCDALKAFPFGRASTEIKLPPVEKLVLSRMRRVWMEFATFQAREHPPDPLQSALLLNVALPLLHPMRSARPLGIGEDERELRTRADRIARTLSLAVHAQSLPACEQKKASQLPVRRSARVNRRILNSKPAAPTNAPRASPRRYFTVHDSLFQRPGGSSNSGIAVSASAVRRGQGGSRPFTVVFFQQLADAAADSSSGNVVSGGSAPARGAAGANPGASPGVSARGIMGSVGGNLTLRRGRDVARALGVVGRGDAGTPRVPVAPGSSRGGSAGRRLTRSSLPLIEQHLNMMTEMGFPLNMARLGWGILYAY
eukprot:1229657-Amorphochlora_amoeboformis.AAC.1